MEQSNNIEVATRKSGRLDRKRSGEMSRDYVLDKKRALGKKLMSCLKDVKIDYTPEDNNHIYTIFTAMYELYKAEIINFYENRAAYDGHNMKIKLFFYITDKANACVETQIKVHQKTQRGCGQLKFTLNLYHTTSRIMANGKNTDLFLKDHGEVVTHIMNMKEVKALDKKYIQQLKRSCKRSHVPLRVKWIIPHRRKNQVEAQNS